MILFDTIKNHLAGTPRQDFHKYAGFSAGALTLLLVGIFYYYYSATENLLGKIRSINVKRQDTQLILKKLKKVKKQSQEVNELLEKEPNFKIKNFFDTAIQQHKLQNKLKKSADISSETLHKKYTERKLTAQLKQISTQQLCEFLQTIEQNPRVYTKELIITKTRGAALDVMLTIATLTQQRESKGKTR
jgi:cell division protein FtsX